MDGALLGSDQVCLRGMLCKFIANYPDIVADNNWRWRFGLGSSDSAVEIVAKTFKLTVPAEERRSEALAALEAIVASEIWQQVSANSIVSQNRYNTKNNGV